MVSNELFSGNPSVRVGASRPEAGGREAYVPIPNGEPQHERTGELGGSGRPGRSLRPITVEIIREELERKRAFPGELVDLYFPTVAERGSVEDNDIGEMTRAQADALSYSLAKGYRSFSKDSQRLQSNGEGLSLDGGILFVNHYEINARQYAIALRDLVDKFDLTLDV